METIIIISSILFVLLLWVLISRQSLKNNKQNCHQKWHQINLLLRKRQDLLPNLLILLKSSTEKQQTTYQNLIDIRAKAARVSEPNQQKITLEKELSEEILKLLDFGKIYKSLSSNTNFLELRKELQALQQKTATEISNYNTLIRQFNKSLNGIFWLLIAKFSKEKPLPAFYL